MAVQGAANTNASLAATALGKKNNSVVPGTGGMTTDQWEAELKRKATTGGAKPGGLSKYGSQLYDSFQTAAKPPAVKPGPTVQQTKPNPVQQQPTSPEATTGDGTDPFNQNLRFSNDYIEQANTMITQLGQMNEQMRNWKYDPSQDAAYQASEKLADAAAQSAQKDTLETMNDRGIINSSMTSSQLAQVAQQAKLKPLELIPQLQGEAWGRQQDTYGNANAMAGMLMNTGLAEQQFQATYPLQEAAVTGRYLPGDAQQSVQDILGLKTAYGEAKTPEERESIRKQADTLRQHLSSLGVQNVDQLLGGGVTSQQASVNAGKLGSMTPQQQQALAGLLLDVGGTYGSIGKGAADVLKGTPLEGVFSGLEGKDTAAQANSTWDQTFKDKTFTWQKYVDGKNITDQATRTKLAQAGQNLQELQFTDDKSYRDWTKTHQINQDFADKNTQKWLSQAMSQPSLTDAMDFLVENASQLYAEGVNVSTVMEGIQQQYGAEADGMPTAAKPAADKPIDMVAVNSKAIAAAQLDPEYKKAFQKNDTATMNKVIQRYREQMLYGTPGSAGPNAGTVGN